jgi:hypothetical protein
MNGHSHFRDTELAESEPSKLTKDSSYSFPVLIDPTSRVASLAEFSGIRTLRRIFTIKTKNDEDSFTFINGIRVLSLFWVIIGHSMAFGASYANNVVDFLSWTHNIFMQLILNALVSVDASIRICCFVIFFVYYFFFINMA